MNCAIHTETPASAYCRTCGKAMCDSCKRDVMGAIYCEPCLAARLQGGAAAAAGVPVAVAAVPGAPNPGVAAMLGFIPGVGAMYNGQFARAFAHVIIFVLLIMATDKISDSFGFLIAFFIFYMVFDAYQSAKARQLGRPAPDPLGIDHMFGTQDTQAPAAVAAPAGDSSEAQGNSSGSLPTGAIVLIVLGVLFLLGNFGIFHMLYLTKIWPVLLIAFGLWIAYRRTAPAA